ncbi:hypothetical protein FRC03_012091 [Tulasnella sp. 419]|nr:hypothetical protein FRC02_006647 [Tulasnella sp. 418]KAG8966388.1 hypothetical protein FRC03_012091 [Tulasnella sp. 419]
MDSSLNTAVSRAQNPITPHKTLPQDEGSIRASPTSRLPKGSFHSTPIAACNTNCTSTHHNQQFKSPRLMQMNVIRHHQDFFPFLLPDLPEKSEFSQSCLNHLPSRLWDKTVKQFTFTSSEGDEKRMYDPLVDTLNAVLDFMATESDRVPSTSRCATSSSSSSYRYEFVRTDRDFANRDVADRRKREPYHNRRPDVSMAFRRDPGSRRSWYDVALSIEVKKDPKKAAVGQAEDQADAILTNAPTKRFLYSFILCSSSLEVCLWDRAGVITSPPIDINKKPLLFIEIIRQFASMAPVDLGFDMTTADIPYEVGYPKERGPIDSPTVAINGEIYYRIQTLSGSTSCFGRSTRCFEARKLDRTKGKWSNKTYLLKYFWNDVKRQPDEGKMYEKVKKAGVQSGVADFVCFVRLSKVSDIRRGLPLLRDVEESNTRTDKKCSTLEGEISGDRQLCILVLATVGRSISKPKTIYELISATRAAIKGKHYAVLFAC